MNKLSLALAILSLLAAIGLILFTEHDKFGLIAIALFFVFGFMFNTSHKRK